MAVVSIDNSYTYRVFISSKSEDYPLAEMVYKFLNAHDVSAFLACKVLQQIGKAEYARAIDKVLDSCEHMIVIASKLEYITSEWVQYEWSTFSDDKKSGYRHGNLMTILTSDISPKDLPASLRHMQSFTYQDYKHSILGYVKEMQAASCEIGVEHIQSEKVTSQDVDEEKVCDLHISIVDKTNPIIPLIGLPAVGKTMTLVRLVRYLTEHGFHVEPDRYFRPKYDDRYVDICDTFQQMVNSAYAAASTSLTSIMMVNVYDKNGRKMCSIIDTPGELYQTKNHELLQYINTIIEAPNPKIWIYFLQPEINSANSMTKFRQSINDITKICSTRNKHVILLNKIDLIKDYVDINNKQQLFSFIENRFPDILAIFRDGSFSEFLLHKFHIYKRPYLMPFQTGSYHESETMGLVYQPSNNSFPQALWDLISRNL